MHSLESLREIRAMEYFLYGGVSREDFYADHMPEPQPLQTGKVFAIAKYNLATRKITVTRVSPEGDLAAQKVR